MTFTEITELTESGQKTTEEKLILLRKIRANLMDELHCKQQVVDQVDYMIYELKMEQKKRNRRILNMEKIVQTAGRNKLGEFAPDFAHFNDDILFGEDWNNQDIDHKTRCIVTVVALICCSNYTSIEPEKTDVFNNTHMRSI